MLTEPWMVDPVRIAPRTNTLPQPIEDRRNELARMRERRRVTNHLAIEKCTPVFHQAEADATDFDMVPDESGKPSQRKLTSCQRFENRKEPAPFGNFRESSVLSEALSAVEGVVGHL